MEKKIILRMLLAAIIVCGLAGCKDKAWNNPHHTQAESNTRHSSFIEPPKTLDPALSYSTDEALFIAQIYEPPLQYHYLKRPYTLEPLTLMQMPKVIYLDAQQRELPANATATQIAFTRYILQIKPNILYQPHPAFAKDAAGNLLYQHLTANELSKIRTLDDFKQTGTRELVADDYVYEIKRLANPKINSPIFGLMAKYIVGFPEYAATLREAYAKQGNKFLDLRQYPLSGVQLIDRYTYAITLRGQYPQFMYWLAMTFFAPIPWEADQFYAQPGLQKKNITLNWYPVGTGPYMLIENNPNSQMVLQRNPNFHGETFPNEGTAEDNEILVNAGKTLPFVDKWIFSLEKETIPRWNKFLQGYYDTSGISSDSFEQAVQVNDKGEAQLTPAMQQQGIRLLNTVEPDIYYFGFNMLDNVVGGYSESARKLRQAISIAMNMEEYINIFLNGRAVPAQGPIPPGIFGYEDGEAGINPEVYDWINGKPKRKSIAEARRLLAEAGYPNGRNVKTGEPLILNFDTTSTTAPDDKARFDWMREEFAKLGIQLNIRATQYNRFQEKMRTGNTQLYFWGWVADYPDPENFLFQLYGPNSKVKHGGENTSNYQNAEYDRLFDQMRIMPNIPERQKIIEQMLAIARQDSPWIWGFHLKQFILTHAWNGPTKPEAIGNNTLKYQSLNPQLRAQKLREWNNPQVWPLGILALMLIVVFVPVVIKYRQKMHAPKLKRVKDGFPLSRG